MTDRLSVAQFPPSFVTLPICIEQVTLGKYTFNDREHAVDDVTDVDLYKVSDGTLLCPHTGD